MNHSTFINSVKTKGNTEKAIQMSAYMRNKFQFLGITSPQRREISKDYLNTLKKEIDWDFVNECWNNPYRELQYVACDYLRKMKKQLQISDLKKIEDLITHKSWWDTVDSLVKLIGYIVLQNPNLNHLMLKWSTNDTMWIRRTAILHQLSRKTQTNTTLLEKIICNNFGQTEFFINKAIGWALRDYSKTNPNWVASFLLKYKNQLTPLSIKEGSKYV